MKIKKTNALRLLDKAKIKYEILTYEVDESDLSAITVAKKINVEIERVFKTLLVRANDGNIFFAVIAGDRELDKKKLAKLANVKSLDLVALKEIENLTGYIRGGVSPICPKKQYKVFFDEDIVKFEKVSLSPGMRGMQMLLNPKELIEFLDAKVGKII